MVAVTVEATTRVSTVNVAVVAPAGTVTVPVTVAGRSADSATTAPPAGAGPFSVAVPLTVSPPRTLAALSEMDTSAGALTVNVADWLVPLIDAVIVVVPTVRAEIGNVPLVAPAAIVSGVCTVATAGLLLVSETTEPPTGAATESETVACTVAPTAADVDASVMPDTPGPVG